MSIGERPTIALLDAAASARMALGEAVTNIAAAGIASITITGTPPTQFIGVTDVSSNNYRIISISENEMVLRSGTPAEAVHQFKFVAQ